VKIEILSVGKTKEPWLQSALSEYEKRLSVWAPLSWTFVKNNDELLSKASQKKHPIALDPNGKEMTSEAFASFLQNELEQSGGRVTFLIGGPEGLPEAIRARTPLVSLSKMTMTHQIARLMLAEQIYRASMILQKRPYHK
jgi:23S rRNA (pseudouridine1915-N3)-methyltransferase